jgi:hypothetical protein
MEKQMKYYLKAYRVKKDYKELEAEVRKEFDEQVIQPYDPNEVIDMKELQKRLEFQEMTIMEQLHNASRCYLFSNIGQEPFEVGQKTYHFFVHQHLAKFGGETLKNKGSEGAQVLTMERWKFEDICTDYVDGTGIYPSPKLMNRAIWESFRKRDLSHLMGMKKSQKVT